MADRPLRPATDRRLGSPLHHQLSNQTRVHLKAINISPLGTSGFSSSFPLLSRSFRQILTRYSPVRHSLPKKFVRLACVRQTASVHPEPGSNSPFWKSLWLSLSNSKFSRKLPILSSSLFQLEAVCSGFQTIWLSRFGRGSQGVPLNRAFTTLST